MPVYRLWSRLFGKPKPAEPVSATAAPEPPYVPDPGVRIHRAAHDPGFPAKREAAIAALTAAVNEVALAQGFAAKSQSWAKTGPLGTVSLHIQRSRYGFDCEVNLGFHAADGAALGPWEEEGHIPLSQFFGEAAAPLIYLDVLEDPAVLPAAMAALETAALPWLLAHLTDPDAALSPIARPKG
jgi:hypothetical protein